MAYYEQDSRLRFALFFNELCVIVQALSRANLPAHFYLVPYSS
jgi:hypothetical protein